MAIIKNRRTGELKIVGIDELKNYNLPTPTPKPDSQQQTAGSSAQLQPDWMGNLLRSNTIPALFSAAGGTIGGLAGPGTGIAGAGVGYGGGEATRRALANLLQTPGAMTDTSDPEQAKQLFQKPLEASAWEAALVGVGKLLSKGPIKMLDDLLTSRLAKNPAVSDVSKIADDFSEVTKPYTESFTQGRDYKKVIDSTNAKLRSSAVGVKNPTGAVQPSSGLSLQGLEDTLGGTNVPISKINEWRKMSGKMGYGSDTAGKISQNLEKKLYELFRKEVVAKEPTAKYILPAESLGMTLQDLTTNLPFGLDRTAFGISRLLGKVGSPLAKSVSAATSPTINNMPNPLSATILYNLLRAGDSEQ